jgi:ferredoxin
MFSASSDVNVGDEFVNINWKKLKDGSVLTTKCRIGENIMRAAHANDIEIEGACEGVCACSTCHVILEDKVFDALPEASEREEDMLDQGKKKHLHTQSGISQVHSL